MSMKRRMPHAERVALEAIARPIVTLFEARSRHSLVRDAQAMTRLVLEVLERGCMVTASPSDSVPLSPVQQWLFAVTAVLRQLARELGPAAPQVMVLRLSRLSEKSARSSFKRIAGDVSDELARGGHPEIVVVFADAEALYRAALKRFVALLAERGIGTGMLDEAYSVSRASNQTFDPNTRRSLIANGMALQRFAQRVERRHQAQLRAAARVPVTAIHAERAVEMYRERTGEEVQVACVV